MPHELLIPPTKFTGRLDSTRSPIVWRSEQHNLMYPRPFAPVGSDRSVQFTVNGFLQMTFNKPLPPDAFITIQGSPVLSYGGQGGYQDAERPIDMAGSQGTFIFGSTVFHGPPLPDYGSSFQIIQFPQSQRLGNLGQSAYYQVTFEGVAILTPYIDIDVTFRGALVSSDPI
jgi:hypothetical protein